MSTTDEQEFDKAFEGFGEEKVEPTPPATPSEDPADPPKVEPPKVEPTPPEVDPKPEIKPAEDPKEDEKPPVEAPKEEEKGTPPPAVDETEPKEEAKPAEGPETPPEPKPAEALTKADVTSIISNLREEDRNSAKAIESTTKEVMEAYYPDGLSNVLIDQASGKELKSPQDVVDASNGQMSTEDAAQWLMNEQYTLDQSVNKIKADAVQIAETTVNFKKDSIAALQKYEPLFKEYPHLQAKVFDKLMKHVKVDKDKGVVLSAPDVMEHYDDQLEPYQQAYEFGKGKPATKPVPEPPVPPAPRPSAEDRMDVSGDAGPVPANDPEDFAQQVSKELAKGA